MHLLSADSINRDFLFFLAIANTHSYPQLPTVTHSWKIGYYYSIVNALILPTAAMLLYPQRLYKHPQLPWLLNIDPPNDFSLILGGPTVTLSLHTNGSYHPQRLYRHPQLPYIMSFHSLNDF